MSKVRTGLLGRLTRRDAVEDDGAHLHWDRENRRWVAHEDARLGASSRQAGSDGPTRAGTSTSRIR
jgi:hypothetical protein